MDYVNENVKKNPGRYCFPEFHIEYDLSCWYPLENGYLTLSDCKGFAKFQYDLPKHWSTFPETTHLGWRGALIRWDHLKMLPDVSYPFPKETIEAFEFPEYLTDERYFTIEISDYPPFNSYKASDTYLKPKFALWRVQPAVESYLIENKIVDTIKYTVIVT